MKAGTPGTLRVHRLDTISKRSFAGETVDDARYVSCELATKGEEQVRIELRYNKHRNCVELRCNEGTLVVAPHAGNVVHIHVNSPFDKVKL